MATRATLRTAARARADQDSSTFPSDTQYNTYLDSAGREVWYDLIRAGWPIAFSNKDITPVGQTTALTAGVTVAFIRGVYRRDGATFTPLKRLNEGRRPQLMSVPNVQADFYDILIDPTLGPVVELLPPPTGGTYRVEYVPEWPGFSGDSDTWYGPGRSDELIVLRAAIAAAGKENQTQTAGALEQEYNRLFEKVTAMASWFDMRNPAMIREEIDPTGRMRRDPFDYNVAGPEGW